MSEERTDSLYDKFLSILDSLPGVEVDAVNPDLERVFFRCNSDDGLFFLGRCISGRYFPHVRWVIEVGITDLKDRRLYYTLEAPKGLTKEQKEVQVEDLIDNIMRHYKHSVFMGGFNLDPETFGTYLQCLAADYKFKEEFSPSKNKATGIEHDYERVEVTEG